MKHVIDTDYMYSLISIDRYQVFSALSVGADAFNMAVDMIYIWHTHEDTIFLHDKENS